MAAASQLRGDISPLTPPPPRNIPLAGIHSPPPPRMPSAESIETPPLPGNESPRTPPFPPPTQAKLYEEVVMAAFQPSSDDDMSPVSDTEFANLSPPRDSPETPGSCSLPSPPVHQAAPATPPPLPPLPPPPLPSYEASAPPPPPQVFLPQVFKYQEEQNQAYCPLLLVNLPGAARKVLTRKILTNVLKRRLDTLSHLQ